MSVFVALGGSPAVIELVGVFNLGHRIQVPKTRVCAATGIKGVPVGTQVEEPDINNTGAPVASTRVAPVIHCPVTHGPPALGGRLQPATA
jgi:hypothetical protein